MGEAGLPSKVFFPWTPDNTPFISGPSLSVWTFLILSLCMSLLWFSEIRVWYVDLRLNIHLNEALQMSTTNMCFCWDILVDTPAISRYGTGMHTYEKTVEYTVTEKTEQQNVRELLQTFRFITRTCLFKYIENFTTKKWKISDKKFWYFFIFLFKNIDCGCSLEPPQRGGSNEYPQSMFLSRIKKNNIYLCKPQFHYIKMGFKGSRLYRYVFVIVTVFGGR